MSFRTRIGIAPAERTDVDELKEACLVAARRCARWTEIDDDLVRRGAVYVSASSDAVFDPVRGIVFEPHSARVVADYAPLHYVVGEDGGLTFYERQSETWTAQLERRAARRRRRVQT